MVTENLCANHVFKGGMTFIELAKDSNLFIFILMLMILRVNDMRLEVRCLCGQIGRLESTGKMKEGKMVCTFACSCDKPEPDYQNPYVYL